MNHYNEALKDHYDSVWNCKDRLQPIGASGRINEVNQYFEVLEIKPGAARSTWTYATAGMAGENGDRSLELHTFSEAENRTWVEVLESTAHYHLTAASLDLGHTVNLGIPVMPDSKLTHALISRPYLDGPKLELFHYGSNTINCLWLIPITQSELDYKKQHGLDALERLFEQTGFAYADPMRASVV